MELYVARWIVEDGEPHLGQWTQVSSEGSTDSHWTSDGREILYVSAGGEVMAVSVTISDSSLDIGKKTSLFRLPSLRTSISYSADGQRILLATAPAAKTQTLRVLTNWRTRLTRSR